MDNGSDEERSENREGSVNDGAESRSEEERSAYHEGRNDTRRVPDGSRYEAAVRELTKDRYIGVDVSCSLQQLSKAQLEDLVGQAQHTSELTVRLYSDESWPILEACQKAAWVISRMAGLRDLAFLWNTYESGSAYVVGRDIDWFLEALANSSIVQLDRLQLPGMGKSLDTWLRFAERHGESIKTLEIVVDHAVEMACLVECTLRTRFGRLEKLGLAFYLADDYPGENLLLLLRAVPQLSVKELCVIIYKLEYTEEGRQLVKNGLDCLAEAVPRSESLKMLSLILRFRELADDSILLERLIEVDRLEELSLEGLRLVDADDGSQQYKTGVTNNNLHKLTLRGCRVGERCQSLISCCKGLNSIAFKYTEPFSAAEELEPDHTDETSGTVLSSRWATLGMRRMIESLDGLTSLAVHFRGKDHINDDMLGVETNADMLWVASRLSSPMLREASLSINAPVVPALRDVVSSCTSLLSLTIDFPSGGSISTPILCAGIESALALPSLDLLITGNDVDSALASILGAVQRNTSLRRFVLRNSSLSGVSIGVVGPLLEAFVATNVTLNYFGVDLDTRDSYLPANVVTFAARGLRNNRHLRAISFLQPPIRFSIWTDSQDAPALVDKSTSEEIAAMLQERNTTLQHIEGVVYESDELEERIRHLLALNRHGEDLVKEARRVPMGLWGDVLSRVSTADCNHFVTKLARQALFGDQHGSLDPAREGATNERAAKRPRL